MILFFNFPLISNEVINIFPFFPHFLCGAEIWIWKLELLLWVYPMDCYLFSCCLYKDQIAL